MSYEQRRAAVREGARAAALDVCLVTSAANVRYLTGFTGSSGWLLLSGDQQLLLTDGRYAEQAPAEARGVEVCIGSKGLLRTFGEVLGRVSANRIGFEVEHVSVGLQRRLAAESSVEWIATEDLVEGVRESKDEIEIGAIQEALRLAETVLAKVGAGLQPGRTEREVAAEIEYACRKGGAEGMAFDTIVASGSRTALPHAGAEDRRLRPGDPVMIDMGCRVNGYCSDITRMIWLGEPAEAKVAELHSAVSAAQEAAIAEVRAGIAAADVDRAARRVISDAGYGELFVHGTGHGVGLEIHEAPAVSGRNDKPLVAGAVITIEPAVYLPGTVGVRLEDMVCVREGGCDRLTTLGTEPMLA